MTKRSIDINEELISKDVLSILLFDHTTNKNIIWGTNDYSKLGPNYSQTSEITTEFIVDSNAGVIKPRISKHNLEQKQRSKEKAEVFTPSWICNKQINLIDNEWFGYVSAFNTEHGMSWKPSKKVLFKNLEKTWIDYIKDKRFEITCGEAPYLVSRYDTTTGQYIEVNNRIGILDRKLRVISENIDSADEWINYAFLAYKSVYGYEFQGDSLLIARENLLLTFMDYYFDKFNIEPSENLLKSIANIISWNLWQMDGLKMVVPFSCGKKVLSTITIFGEEQHIEKCEGCEKGDLTKHNGLYCLIMDWEENQTVRYIDLYEGIIK